MTDLVKRSLISRFEAALAMLRECVAKRPDKHWDTPIAKHPFWMVAHHTLRFVDLYLGPREEHWRPSPRFRPAGMAEPNEEHPSRRFDRAEVLDHLAHGPRRTRDRLGAETESTLAGECGLPR